MNFSTFLIVDALYSSKLSFPVYLRAQFLHNMMIIFHQSIWTTIWYISGTTCVKSSCQKNIGAFASDLLNPYLMTHDFYMCNDGNFMVLEPQ